MKKFLLPGMALLFLLPGIPVLADNAVIKFDEDTGTVHLWNDDTPQRRNTDVLIRRDSDIARIQVYSIDGTLAYQKELVRKKGSFHLAVIHRFGPGDKIKNGIRGLPVETIQEP